jgi:hypothetical protein
MIKSASFRVCKIDGKPVRESEAFRNMVRDHGVREAVKETEVITVNFEEIRRNGSAELNRIVDLITNGVPPGRSEAV